LLLAAAGLLIIEFSRCLLFLLLFASIALTSQPAKPASYNKHAHHLDEFFSSVEMIASYHEQTAAAAVAVAIDSISFLGKCQLPLHKMNRNC